VRLNYARARSITTVVPLRPLALLLATAAAIAIAPAADATAAVTAANWNKSEQKTVLKAGLMQRGSDGGFDGDRPLSAGQLQQALDTLSAQDGGTASSAGSRPPTVADFDRIVVRQLGLTDVADQIQGTARSAGLRPPARFGTEVVARFLKLRFNHPAGQDNLELYPTDKITRAEAAHSFAVILGWGGWETQNARNELGQFSLPTYDAKQKKVLRLAVSKIGLPYVWGGESDGTSSVVGLQAHGGYDCSGFAWRVYKLSGNPAGKQLGGRTAEAMSLEIPKSKRLGLSQVKGADLLFFGTPVDHMGIALSNEWMIHSSDQGVYVTPLFEDWRRASFRWARRVL
jgi:cell wall-associated NlpC family hydrolase